MERINVTKTFLPPIEEYEEYLKQIWASGQLTNQGPLLMKFEAQVSSYLDVENFHFVANGTLAIQLAFKALDIEQGEIITTPFSYVASSSAILWEGFKPVYVDIDANTLCIDPTKIEAAITKDTKAILAVHVFGNVCDIDAVEAIAKKYNLKVVYDAAHAFGVKYKGKSVLSYGDISTCSFHSTKIFHTIEGGAIIANDPEVDKKLELLKRFGHQGDDHLMLGINAKASEFQAAMGLCNLKYVDKIIAGRRSLTKLYDKLLGTSVKRLTQNKDSNNNYSYYPIIVDTEKELNDIISALEAENIYPRRYFYPSLNKLPYLTDVQSCPISESISGQIVCLPLYLGLDEKVVEQICKIITK